MANDYELSNNGNPICPDDLISLSHLHEPAVVECLQNRYEDDQIYTATGPVLLALNPFQNIRGLYGESTMKRYWEKSESQSKETLPPHVYAIADEAFRSMMRSLEQSLGGSDKTSCDQSILVSGESGSGKTVTTKFVMKYLAALSQRAGSQTKEKQAQVLQSNPILESFGNARTMRNDNSSRFGKFIEIQFTRTGRLVGAQIDTYLLEKVRLVTQSIGERNYHIFYEMLSGSMGAEELRNYFIASTASPDDFKMTASGTYDRRDGVSDKDTCRALKAAMKTMKFSTEEQSDVFAAVAAILHSSNLTFCDLDEYCSLDAHNVHLEPVCHLLGVTAEGLNQALCHFSISAGNDTQVQQNLEIDKAEKGLEALLKATYGALFTYLVTRINDSICYSPDQNESLDENGERPHSKDAPSASIGVLDIFGFESFKTNSFEQLCINYCNEALQQQFNAFVLKNEQAEYEREGIEWSFIEFPENQDVIDLIDKRGSGILCILDDQCRAPGTSDRSFALDVYNKCKNQTRFSANRKQTAVLQFCVNHYAGPVEYTTNGFVEKNRDELPKEATELLQNSFNPFIRLLSTIMKNSSAERNSSSNSASFGRTTVGGQFRRQLKLLREKIDIMSPHYVRCLKPNDELVADHYDRAAVAEQLRCGGILEAVRVARAGYSNHYSHDEFLRRYRCLATPEINRKSFSRNTCGTTSESARVGVQIGKTKVFLRHKAFESLERLRSQEQSRAAVKINSIFRMFLSRVAYVHVRTAVRKSMLDLHAFQNDEWKESKEDNPDDAHLLEFFNRLNKMRHSFNGESFSLVEVWAGQMRESIHNPKPRSEWGNYSPSKPFTWMLVDGLWTKNHDDDLHEC
ncbi:Myosin_head-domain-containing protein [Fragilariopsis cylindrus CCMP1102]|uniref:Myosin_head-domain-containing protein n=1 Tax=Fragilariopsis cylindrus CCMP1102 TaxID=635003 RepID=A0A1E7F5G1_9STRA|nr:Myosin_head-domain-containing protein [Fragilariopsis cylindrus CCMP1102]|eukprot:OEU13397.1 Myosin_head-domain-containing protein [Fragilariopsis cylindrus CCMP1102]